MTRKVTMRLVGEDGNAFAILGRFQRVAKAAGWTREEIKAVTDDATGGDYDHLLATIAMHIEDPDGTGDVTRSPRIATSCVRSASAW